jgi:ADP-ribose pyrophosphatase
MWTIKTEETILKADPFLRIHRQRVRTDNGQDVSDYYQIELPAFSLVCAADELGRIITIWQYKHGPRRRVLTFPGGVVNAGETAEAAARRELLEETGYCAGEVRFLGRFACTSNQGCGFANLFAATRCIKVGVEDSGDLGVMQLRLMSSSEIELALRMDEIGCLADVALWGLVRRAAGTST